MKDGSPPKVRLHPYFDNETPRIHIEIFSSQSHEVRLLVHVSVTPSLTPRKFLDGQGDKEDTHRLFITTTPILLLSHGPGTPVTTSKFDW